MKIEHKSQGKKHLPWVLTVMVFFFSSFSQAACLIQDDKGNQIKLDKPARRIISLAPDITETLFAIGAGNQVVGVVSGSDYPQAAQTIPKMGSYSGIDLEKVIELRPDLIVTWSQAFSRQIKVLK